MNVTVLAVDGQLLSAVVRTARDRAVAQAHRRAIRRFLDTGDAYLLARLAGRRIGQVELAGDVSVVEAAAREGRLR